MTKLHIIEIIVPQKILDNVFELTLIKKYSYYINN